MIELGNDERGWPTVARLRTFRAIDTLTALSIHLELGGDWVRFERPHRLGAWLGLTPSLTQSGEASSSGSITKTGSTLARRLLIEAAWHYGPRPSIGPVLQARQATQPEQILAISTKTQRRLHHVYQQMKARGKPHGVITIAVRPRTELPFSGLPPPPDPHRHPDVREGGAPGRQRGQARAQQL